MRTRTAVLALALLTVPLLAGCGGDDDDDAAGATTTTQAVEGSDTDDGDDAAESDGDAQATVDAVQLEAADLGDGWTLTETKPAGDDDDDESNPLDTCMETDIGDRMDDAKVAETEERTFTQEGDGTSPIPAQVTSSAVEIDDEGLFEETYDLVESDEFVGCLTSALDEELQSSAPDADVTIGEISTGPALDVDEFPEARSTAITIPLTIASSGVSVDLVMALSFVNQGAIGASLFAFGPGDQPIAELSAELAGTLASRMPAA
jgi:hypothetical protein